MFKFRTMRTGSSGAGVTMDRDPRITAVGRVLRKTKLDELPELWNVVRGDMAIVGPRPEVPQYVDENDPRWREVLKVKPGLTDPVTVALRNEERLLASAGPDRERFYVHSLLPWKLDGNARYLRIRTPWSDMAVLAATVVAVLHPSAGASFVGVPSVTVESCPIHQPPAGGRGSH
jgi:lipopolysaccharide/colanic/teichoic acid biosynthesis glycosyltransferase